MFTILTERGEPMQRCGTFAQAYEEAQAETRRRGAAVLIDGPEGRYEILRNECGWFRVTRRAA